MNNSLIIIILGIVFTSAFLIAYIRKKANNGVDKNDLREPMKSQISQATVNEIIAIHEEYRKSVHIPVDDLRFWGHFINNWAIPEYQRQNEPRIIHSSGYGVYDFSDAFNKGFLKMSSEVRNIHSKDLEEHSGDFFNWLMNLSLVRAYNALEILILQSTNACFLNLGIKTSASKRDMNKIHSEIGKKLNLKSDRVNNKHLIQFLCENSDDFKKWVKDKVRYDGLITREDFFYLISVLRHCVVHQAAILSKDSLNEINSKSSKDFFSQFFTLVDAGNNCYEFKPIQEKFIYFLDLSIEFAVNTLTFVAKQPNFRFLKMSNVY